MIGENSGKYELEADVVVVGYGGAGATAAITAHDNGAEVIIIEKMPTGGGNTALAGGGFLTPTDLEKAVKYILALSNQTVEQEIIQSYVANAMENKSWITQIGGETEQKVYFEVTYPSPPTLASHPQVPGGESMVKLHVKGGKGERRAQQLWELLSSNIDKRGIRVMLNSPAQELITNQKGEVVGVVAETGGKRIAIGAKKAVILTCGGFEYNEAMHRNFLPCPFYALGSPGNTGDGIKMAQKVGADLWHMAAVSSYYGFKPEENKAQDYKTAFGVKIYSERFIFVDLDGKRFFNETGMETHDLWRASSLYDSSRLCYPRIPTYLIFDDVARRKGPLHPDNSGGNREYKWSLDNSEEIKKGWISQGKTIDALARTIGMDGSTLENTVAKYNEYCRSSKDADFLRRKETLGPIETSPYYAMKVRPALLNTQGGPRRDKSARVLDPYGKPIPRLYAAGELGSIWGFMYQGAGNIGECLAFGRIAGRNAAAEERWQ